MSSFSVDGLAELDAKLKDLALNVARKKLRNAVAAGGRVVLKRMRELAPVKHDIGGALRVGELRKSLRVKSGVSLAKGSATASIGPSKKTSFVANWLEKGAASHVISITTTYGRRRKPIANPKKVLSNERTIFGKSVHHPGVSPKPFMRQALDSAQVQAVEALRDKLASGIEEIVGGK